jgi:hypothetical protein
MPEKDIFLPTFGTDLQYTSLFSASNYPDAAGIVHSAEGH